MGRSGLVGMVSILLLLLVAVIVMMTSAQGSSLVARALGQDTTQTVVMPPTIPPAMRRVTPSGGMEQADRAIRDLEAVNSLSRQATDAARGY